MAKQRKYEFTDEVHYVSRYIVLKRIRALIDIPTHDIKAGDLGGWIQKVSNLPHENQAWVSENAKVYGDAVIEDDSLVFGDAEVSGKCHVFGRSIISGLAELNENVSIVSSTIKDAYISGYVTVKNSMITGDSIIKDNVVVEDSHIDINSGKLLNQTRMFKSTVIGKNLLFEEHATISNSTIGLRTTRTTSECTFSGQCELDNVHIDGAQDVKIDGFARIIDGVKINGNKILANGYSRIVGRIILSSNSVISDMAQLEKKGGMRRHTITNIEYLGDTCVIL